MASSVRQSIMRAVRMKNQGTFQDVIERMVAENSFLPDQCMVLEIAKASAKALGLSPDVVEMVTLHHNRKCARFTHEVYTPVPPPPQAPKGAKKEIPVLTRTEYSVVAESAKIVGYREFKRTGEIEDNLGGEYMVTWRQRPNRTQFPNDE